MVAAAPSEKRFQTSEIYTTIQGESSLTGVPTVFVRLYTCNLRCVWCDSMHAVEGGDFREMAVDDLVGRVRELAASGKGPGIRHLCWTGGEPLLQWRAIVHAINRLPGDFVHTVETDGEVPIEPLSRALRERREKGLLRYIMDVKCPGSGMKARLAFENLRHLRPVDEVKFVILDRGDYEFARDVVSKHEMPTETILFSPVTPAHTVREGLDPAKMATWILEDGLPVRLQLQVHKFIWPGRERGI